MSVCAVAAGRLSRPVGREIKNAKVTSSWFFLSTHLISVWSVISLKYVKIRSYLKEVQQDGREIQLKDLGKVKCKDTEWIILDN